MRIVLPFLSHTMRLCFVCNFVVWIIFIVFKTISFVWFVFYLSTGSVSGFKLLNKTGVLVKFILNSTQFLNGCYFQDDSTKIEYRAWNPFRSKLAAAILGGVESIHMKPGAKVLYLGAASGTTVSHVSDIVGPVSNRSLEHQLVPRQLRTRHFYLNWTSKLISHIDENPFAKCSVFEFWATRKYFNSFIPICRWDMYLHSWRVDCNFFSPFR